MSSDDLSRPPVPFGRLAAEIGQQLPLQVLKSRAGFYLGTASDDGPVSRESAEYWSRKEQADQALARGCWTQRLAP